MKTTLWALAVVLAAGLLMAELVMDVTPPERRRLYLVFGLMAVSTFVAAVVAVRLATRLSSLRASLVIVSLAAVGVTGAAVAAAAMTMFIEPHDLTLVMVALLLGVGLGGVVASGVARPLASDLEAISIAAERAGDGDLTARSGVHRTDELGATAAALDAMIEKLELAEEERRVLLSAVGHDLRTPLGSMQAAVEALQDGVAPDPAAYLRGLSNDLEHLRHLVDDLFLLSRIEAGRLELSASTVDLAELADEAMEAVAPAAARRGVRVRVEAPGHVGVVGDPAALGRVFRNLLANAVRHSPETGEVRIVVTRNRSMAEVAVVDQGEGFPDQLRDRVFERFVRADDSRNRESGGTGLGLAIAKGIVEAHHGTIAVEDGPGGQVRFTVPLA
ncbi:MAG TPA: HAMP domain-containing sensor histidine kinase [Acidimicrobiia bacterium]|nr:HAMP domain-containing sensor histidine kinase [Acidimicrobiia bacterium]